MSVDRRASSGSLDGSVGETPTNLMLRTDYMEEAKVRTWSYGKYEERGDIEGIRCFQLPRVGRIFKY